MAIGLGRMLGFHFLENFDYPYIAKSVGEFWRRWHISMGTWFRDYVYIPLGGSRGGKVSRIIFNLFVVWLLTGIWHGANWTFIVWGLWHFLWIAFERITNIPKRCSKVGSAVYRVITILAVVLGWVLFRSDNLGSAWIMVKAMFGGATAFTSEITATIWADISVTMVIAMICAVPIAARVCQEKMGFIAIAKKVAIIVLFVICLAFVCTAKYDPFIYFNF